MTWYPQCVWFSWKRVCLTEIILCSEISTAVSRATVNKLHSNFWRTRRLWNNAKLWGFLSLRLVISLFSSFTLASLSAFLRSSNLSYRRLVAKFQNCFLCFFFRTGVCFSCCCWKLYLYLSTCCSATSKRTCCLRSLKLVLPSISTVSLVIYFSSI